MGCAEPPLACLPHLLLYAGQLCLDALHAAGVQRCCLRGAMLVQLALLLAQGTQHLRRALLHLQAGNMSSQLG